MCSTQLPISSRENSAQLPMSIACLLRKRRISAKTIRLFHTQRSITTLIDKKSTKSFQIPMASRIQRIAAAAVLVAKSVDKNALPRSVDGNAVNMPAELARMRTLIHETTGPVLSDLDRMFNRAKGRLG